MGRMNRGVGEGVLLFLVGAGLWLFTGDVEIPVFTLSKVGVVLMVIGAVTLVVGLVTAARRKAVKGDR
ncbi:hypothetical protein LX16_1704 [Stackebrandtia albiflava]|uniref:Uncharacterized protein n=1 Tax=Stackebrandtia albiflava TaxID=406432 RepID=A0A562VDM7_9ACTN|nr:DUF5708 family protein [Stackebrandtia albiflava]TWJ15984.1 hypothetical protein LX16_1704 [Stackebrandtia albiflava]